MNGLILAAGRGSRMGEMTQDIPKCLTPLSGKPLINWQMEAFSQAGIRSFAIVTGYKAELLESMACPTFHNPRWQTTNMVASLMAADLWLSSGPCTVSYADIVYHPEHLKRLTESTGDLAITYDTLWQSLWELRFEEPLKDAETFQIDASGCVLTIGQRAQSVSEIQGQYMGLIRITPMSWQTIKSYVEKLSPSEQASLDMTSLLRGLIGEGYIIQGIPVEGKWCEVDTQLDAQRYEKQLLQDAPWTHDWRAQAVSAL